MGSQPGPRLRERLMHVRTLDELAEELSDDAIVLLADLAEASQIETP